MYKIKTLDFGHGIVNAQSQTGSTHTFGFIDLELMQYTGLKDKNGKEIYEGDILNVDAHYPAYGGKWEVQTTLVSFEVGGFLHRSGRSNFCERLSANMGQIQVIGNRFENPDLLTAKAQQNEER